MEVPLQGEIKIFCIYGCAQYIYDQHQMTRVSLVFYIFFIRWAIFLYIYLCLDTNCPLHVLTITEHKNRVAKRNLRSDPLFFRDPFFQPQKRVCRKMLDLGILYNTKFSRDLNFANLQYQQSTIHEHLIFVNVTDSRICAKIKCSRNLSVLQ